MAEETTNNKKLGTVTRGVNNEALTPGNKHDEEQSTQIMDVINGGVDKLIGAIEKSFEQKVISIIKQLSSIDDSTITIYCDMVDKLSSIEDKMMAIVAALYSVPSIKANDPSTQFTKLVGKQGITKFYVDSFDNQVFSDFTEQLFDALSSKGSTTSSFDSSNISKQIIDTFGGLLSNFQSSIYTKIDNFEAKLPKIIIDGVTFNFDDLTNNLGTLKELVNKHIIDDNSNLLNDVHQIINVLDNDLNGFVLDESVISSLEALTNVLKNFGNIKEFPEHLNPNKDNNIFTNINTILEKVNSINPKAKENISNYADIIRSISSIYNIKLPQNDTAQLNKFIRDITSTVQTFVDGLKGLSKDQKNSADAIGTLLNSVINLGNFDKKKYKETVRTLKKIRTLTEKPTSFSRLGLSNKGLIWQILNNLSIAAQSSKISNKDAKSVSKIFEAIVDINKAFDIETSKELVKKSRNLAVALDDEHLYAVISSLAESLTIAKNNKLTEKNLSYIISIFDFVNTLSKTVDTKTVLALSFKVSLLEAIFDMLPRLWDLIAKANEGAEETRQQLAIIHSVLGEIKSSDVKKINALVEYLKSLSKLSKALLMLSVVAKGASKTTQNIEAAIDPIQNVIDSLDRIKIDKKTVEKLKDVESLIVSVTKVLLLGAFVGAFAIIASPLLLGFAAVVGLFMIMIIGSINIATKGMKSAITGLANFDKLLVASAAVMIIGGIIMTKYLKLIWGGLLFGAVLGLFIYSVTKAIAKGFEDYDPKTLEDVVNDFALIVALSGGMMLAGGLFMLIPGLPLATLEFSALLAAFIFGVSYIYSYIGPKMKDYIKDAENFGMLVALTAGSLLIGALFIRFGFTKDILTFGSILLGFVLTLGLGFTLFAKIAKPAMEGAENLAMLVALSAASLILGAAFVRLGWAKEIMIFGGILAAFVLAICGVYSVASKWIKNSVDVSKSFMILVSISAGILILGGLAMNIIDPTKLLAFTGSLVIFITAICGVYLLASKWIEKALNISKSFMVLVAISAGILILGGLAMKVIGDIDYVLGFAALVVVFTAAMAGVFYLLGRMQKNILQGFGAMIAIVAAAGAMAFVLTLIAKAAAITDMGKLWNAVGVMTTIILEFAAMIIVLGSMFLGTMGIGAGVFAAGAAGMIATIAIAILAAETVMMIAQAAEVSEKAKSFNTRKIMDIVNSMVSVVDVFEPLSDRTNRKVIRGASKTVDAMVKMIKKLGDVVEHVANLSVFEFDRNGKITNVRKLGRQDFENAANNINTIITTLGGAIIKAYTDHPEMFKKPFLGETPFTTVVKSCTRMHRMINKLAKAVHRYATMTVKDPVTGKDRVLGKQDFENAANNIKTIIEVVGNAIIDTYNGNEEMFKKPFLGNTPFVRVVKSCASMSSMIVELASAVQQYASMTVKDPVTGKERTLDENDFIIAHKHITKIITLMGGAILNAYTTHPEMFKKPLIGDTPFVRVSKAYGGMGSMISEIANAVRDYANFTVKDPVTGKERVLEEADFEKASTNIATVLTTLGGAIIQTYEDHPELFTDPSLWHTNADKTPFGMTVKAMTGVGTLVSDSAESIKMVHELMNTTLKGVDLDELSVDTGKILTAVANAIIATYKADPKLFEDASFWHTSAEKTPFYLVRTAMDGTGQLVKDCIEGVKMVNELGLTTKDITKHIYPRIRAILKCLPYAIISATVESKDEKIKKIFAKPKNAAELFERIKSIYTDMEDTFNNVFDIYKSIHEATTGENAMNIGLIRTSIESMLTALPEILNSINVEEDGEQKISVLSEIYSDYATAITRVLEIYKTAQAAFNELGATKSADPLNVITENLRSSVSGIKETLDIINIEGNVELETGSFITLATNYKTGVNVLADALKLIPDELSKNKMMLEAIRSINLEITRTPELKQFEEETKLLDSYVKTVNNIDTNKVDKFVGLTDSIVNMSTKLGSLEELTDVLSNQLTTVLTTLSDRLEESAKTIKTAEKIQDKRHEKIKEALKQMKDLMNKPVEINVKHSQEATNDNSMSAGSANGDTQQPSSSTNNNSSSNSTGGYTAAPAVGNQASSVPQNNGGSSTQQRTTNIYFTQGGNNQGGPKEPTGISPEQAREIAKTEIELALEQLRADNNLRGSSNTQNA